LESVVPAKPRPKEVEWTPRLVIEDAGEAEHSGGIGSMRSWTDEDAAEALEAFHGLERTKQARAAERLRTNGIAEMPPALRGEAWRVALEAGTIPRAGTGSAREVIRRLVEHAVSWALHDAGAAAEWATRLPAGEERTWVLRNLAAVWAEAGPAEGRRWAEGLADEAEREMVLQKLGDP
jgi:hypothetical protein